MYGRVHHEPGQELWRPETQPKPNHTKPNQTKQQTTQIIYKGTGVKQAIILLKINYSVTFINFIFLK